MKSSYKMIALMLPVHFIVMLLLTYALVDTVRDIYLNINRAYMAALMVAPMLPLMLLFMRSMYPDARRNLLLSVGALLVFAVVFVLARTQTPVGDGQFLRSMIPHHSSAIVMCERSSIKDPEIVELCRQIVQSQKREIAQMKAIMARMDRGSADAPTVVQAER